MIESSNTPIFDGVGTSGAMVHVPESLGAEELFPSTDQHCSSCS